MNWVFLWTGLALLAVVAIAGMLLAASDAGIWLVMLLPLTAVIGGAVVLAGRDAA